MTQRSFDNPLQRHLNRLLLPQRRTASRTSLAARILDARRAADRSIDTAAKERRPVTFDACARLVADLRIPRGRALAVDDASAPPLRAALPSRLRAEIDFHPSIIEEVSFGVMVLRIRSASDYDRLEQSLRGALLAAVKRHVEERVFKNIERFAGVESRSFGFPRLQAGFLSLFLGEPGAFRTALVVTHLRSWVHAHSVVSALLRLDPGDDGGWNYRLEIAGERLAWVEIPGRIAAWIRSARRPRQWVCGVRRCITATATGCRTAFRWLSHTALPTLRGAAYDTSRWGRRAARVLRNAAVTPGYIAPLVSGLTIAALVVVVPAVSNVPVTAFRTEITAAEPGHDHELVPTFPEPQELPPAREGDAPDTLLAEADPRADDAPTPARAVAESPDPELLQDDDTAAVSTEYVTMAAVATPGTRPATGRREVPVAGVYYFEDFGVDFGSLVSLTFDDGPNLTLLPDGRTVTDSILDTLAHFSFPATFFVNGKQIISEDGSVNPESRRILRRIVDEGHVIGNHGFSHGNLSRAPYRGDPLAIADEILRNEKAVTRALGEPYKMRFFRPPYAEGGRSSEVDQVVQNLGLKYAFFQIDSFDYLITDADDVEKAYQRLRADFRSSTGGAVLLHDLPVTARYLQDIIGELASGELSGVRYQFVSLDRLLLEKNGKLAERE